jgi:hypothetical protein
VSGRSYYDQVIAENRAKREAKREKMLGQLASLRERYPLSGEEKNAVQRKSYRKRYAAEPEKVLAPKRESYQANREKVLARAAAYRADTACNTFLETLQPDPCLSFS